MSKKKIFLLTDDTGKKDKSEIYRLAEEDNFLKRALIKNNESRKRYMSHKLFIEPLQKIENRLQLQAAESWLLTG